jgi:hypothetical protein
MMHAEFDGKIFRFIAFLKMNKSVNPRDALFDPEVGVTDERKVFTLNQSFH